VVGTPAAHFRITSELNFTAASRISLLQSQFGLGKLPRLIPGKSGTHRAVLICCALSDQRNANRSGNDACGAGPPDIFDFLRWPAAHLNTLARAITLNAPGNFNLRTLLSVGRTGHPSLYQDSAKWS